MTADLEWEREFEREAAQAYAHMIGADLPIEERLARMRASASKAPQITSTDNKQ